MPEQPSKSPFHRGELLVQTRMGVRDQIDAFARKVVREFMPEQHREFYAALPFMFLGTVDDEGQPWASMVVGRPGFISSPDPRTLQVAALPPPGDPLRQSLSEGHAFGALGIELHTRRRNRMNGTIRSVGPSGFELSVGQAFGNCPQYIQARETHWIEEAMAPPKIKPDTSFDGATQRLIEEADTLFIASAFQESKDDRTHGVDVSHRGGRPGFVRLEDERTFVFPDFSGNNHYNTVGNLVLNPKAGFLFVDFDSQSLVYLTGETEIEWSGPTVRAFEGAQRLIRFRASRVIRVKGSLPLRFQQMEPSPALKGTGVWSEAQTELKRAHISEQWRELKIKQVVQESETIRSLILKPVEDDALDVHQPGQFLPIRVTLPGQVKPTVRTYSISSGPNEKTYRLSIKREREGGVSAFVHDHLKEGDSIEAKMPRGKFVLDRAHKGPIALISAGVGLTPLVSMVEAMALAPPECPVHFIHGARDGSAHAFGARLRALQKAHDWLNVHVRYSRPREEDRAGVDFDSAGRVDMALLSNLLPQADYDYYLCGPEGFMRDLHASLTAKGVPEDRIAYEAFGPATVLSTKASSKDAAPVLVQFRASQKSVTWDSSKGTLLELAESAGLSPNFSCRTGVCGSCATRVVCGEVEYLKPTTAAREDSEALLCCAQPKAGGPEHGCGEDAGLILDL